MFCSECSDNNNNNNNPATLRCQTCNNDFCSNCSYNSHDTNYLKRTDHIILPLTTHLQQLKNETNIATSSSSSQVCIICNDDNTVKRTIRKIRMIQKLAMIGKDNDCHYPQAIIRTMQQMIASRCKKRPNWNLNSGRYNMKKRNE